MSFLFYLFYFIIMNLIGFQVVVYDKKVAKNYRMRRVDEAAFFLLAIFGGAVGIFAGMLIVNHKTRKLRFVLGMPIIIFFHVFLSVLYFLWFVKL
ncbi:MAG: DUF1294 domain-containing protein [Clostridia bacterium]